jgi:hypothetical protein
LKILGVLKRHIRLVVPAIAVLVVLLAAGSFYGRGSVDAQTPPDGGGADGGAAAGASAEANLSMICGLLRRQYVRTYETSFTTTSTAFVPVPFLTMNASVAAGPAACVIVTFSGEMAATGASNHCYLRALIGGVEMSPTGQGARDAVSVDGTAEAVTYLWVHRPLVGANLPISIQVASNTAGQGCWVDDTLLRIEVFA